MHVDSSVPVCLYPVFAYVFVWGFSKSLFTCNVFFCFYVDYCASRLYILTPPLVLISSSLFLFLDSSGVPFILCFLCRPSVNSLSESLPF